jgi:hypothetical protein
LAHDLFRIEEPARNLWAGAAVSCVVVSSSPTAAEISLIESDQTLVGRQELLTPYLVVTGRPTAE